MGFGRGIGFSPAAPPPVVPELEFYLPCWHNRDVLSNHGTWSLCRNGINEAKLGNYQRPDSDLLVRTHLVAKYYINRAYLSFDTQAIPAGATITAAKLGLCVADIPDYQFILCITKGLWDEPVLLSDFGLQTDETTILGQMNTADMVVGQYNWIDLNAAGIAWINQRPIEINQHESYDWKKTAYLLFYPPYWRSESFTPQNSHTLTKVRLRLRRKGLPGTLNIHIRAADASHLPILPDLATGSIDGNSLTDAGWGDWYLIDLGAGVALSANTEYCIILEAPSSTSSKYVEWVGSTASNYPNGLHALSSNNGVTWAAQATQDGYFIEYETAQVGGTKFCLRTAPDVGNSPPGAGAIYNIRFYSAQKAEGGAPLLAVMLEE